MLVQRKLCLEPIVSAAHIHRQPPGRTGPALWSMLFFPWDSSSKGLEITVPHPHGEHVQGLIPLENIPFPDSLRRLLDRQPQSQQHDRACCTNSHPHAHPLSIAPFVAPTLCFPSLLCPFTTSQRETREGQKSESSLQNLPFFVWHSLDSLRHPSSSCCFAPVSGKS